MKKLNVLLGVGILVLAMVGAATAQTVLPSTPYTRIWLRSTNATDATIRLQGTNFTVAWLSDPHDFQPGFSNACNWVASNAVARSIKFLLIPGDFFWPTGDPFYDQMDRASNALKRVMSSNVVVLTTHGNHDYDGGPASRSTVSNNTYFPYDFFTNQTGFYGAYMAATTNDGNIYATYTNGSARFLFLGLEFDPASNTLVWAQSILNSYTNHQALIFQHSFIRGDGTLIGEGRPDYSGGVGGAYDSMRWTNLLENGYNPMMQWKLWLRTNSTVFGLICGHSYEFGYTGMRWEKTDPGRLLAIMHNDPQGAGVLYLRLMEFCPSENKVIVATYNPVTMARVIPDFTIPIVSYGDLPALTLDQQAAANSDRLVLYLRCDENAGTNLLDSSPYHKFLFSSNVSAQVYEQGIYGTAIKITNYAPLIRDFDHLYMLSNLTISLWAKATNVGQAYSMWVTEGDATAANSAFWFGGSSNETKLRVHVKTFNGLTNSQYEATPTLPGTWTDGVWHHYGMVWSFNKLVTYCDGAPIETNNVVNLNGYTWPTLSSQTLANGMRGLALGADSDSATSDRTTNTCLDEIRIYERALTAEEMKALYVAGSSLSNLLTLPNIITNGLYSLAAVSGPDATASSNFVTLSQLSVSNGLYVLNTNGAATNLLLYGGSYVMAGATLSGPEAAADTNFVIFSQMTTNINSSSNYLFTNITDSLNVASNNVLTNLTANLNTASNALVMNTNGAATNLLLYGGSYVMAGATLSGPEAAADTNFVIFSQMTTNINSSSNYLFTNITDSLNVASNNVLTNLTANLNTASNALVMNTNGAATNLVLSGDSYSSSYFSSPSPTYSTNVATKAYVDTVGTFGQGWYFWGSSNHPTLPAGSNYYTMQKSDVAIGATLITNSSVNPDLDSYPFAFASREAAGVTVLRAATYSVHFVAYRSSGGGDAATLRPEVYVRTAAGVETEVATPSIGEVLTSTKDSYTTTFTITTNVTMAVTDFILVKFKLIAKGGTPTLYFVSEGDTAAGITIPVASVNFVLKSGDTMIGALSGPAASASGNYVPLSQLQTNVFTTNQYTRTGVPRWIWVDAGAMGPCSNGVDVAAATATNRQSGLTQWDYWQFADAVTNAVSFGLVLGRNWNLDTNTVKVKLFFTTPATNNPDANTNMVWSIMPGLSTPDDTSNTLTNLTGVRYITTNYVDYTAGGIIKQTAPIGPFNFGATPSTNSFLMFRVARLGGFDGDTLTNAAGVFLRGALIQYVEPVTEPALW